MHKKILKILKINKMSYSGNIYTKSGYKLHDAFEEFQKNILTDNPENANKWGIELIVSDNNEMLWQCILNFYLRFINISSIELLNLIIQYYKKFLSKNKKYKEIRELINDDKYRKDVSIIITTICNATKNNYLSPFDSYEDNVQ